MLNSFKPQIAAAISKGLLVESVSPKWVTMEDQETGSQFTTVCKPSPKNPKDSIITITYTNRETGYTYIFNFNHPAGGLISIEFSEVTHHGLNKRPAFENPDNLFELSKKHNIAEDMFSKLLASTVQHDLPITGCSWQRKRQRQDPENAIIAVDQSWANKLKAPRSQGELFPL